MKSTFARAIASMSPTPTRALALPRHGTLKATQKVALRHSEIKLRLCSNDKSGGSAFGHLEHSGAASRILRHKVIDAPEEPEVWLEMETAPIPVNPAASESNYGAETALPAHILVRPHSLPGSPNTQRCSR